MPKFDQKDQTILIVDSQGLWRFYSRRRQQYLYGAIYSSGEFILNFKSENSEIIYANSVVLLHGTFLNVLIHIGVFNSL